MTSSGARASADVRYDIVIPTIGRPSVGRLLAALVAEGAAPDHLVLVDDRPPGGPHLDVLGLPPGLRAEVVESGGRGPAAARNAGVAAIGAAAPWIVFLDDDVVVDHGWADALAADLHGAPADVAAVQARVRVPLPAERRPTDWERHTAHLQRARWITADLAVRADAFAGIGGFDERFPRAFREDSDLALRLIAAGHRLVVGTRRTIHPVRPAGPWASVRVQAGNADHARMRAKHGARYAAALGEPASTFPGQLRTVVVGVAALGAAVIGRRRLAGIGGAWWATRWLRFAAARIGPGPRTPREIGTMLVTSAAIPPAAVFHRARGWRRVIAERTTPAGAS